MAREKTYVYFVFYHYVMHGSGSTFGKAELPVSQPVSLLEDVGILHKAVATFLEEVESERISILNFQLLRSEG
ncbi:MAG: hypothetical protein Q7S95_02805 [bacterium]|nr:hypothetical protein [bacterium]